MPKDICNILLISPDNQWKENFIKGIENFLHVNCYQPQNMEMINQLVQDSKIDLIIVAQKKAIELTQHLKDLLHKVQSDCQILSVIEQVESCDVHVKAGADFVSYYDDNVTTLRYVRTANDIQKLQKQSSDSVNKKHSIANLYYQLYHHLYEPICYLREDGVFLDANQSFLDTFLIKNTSALEQMTVMNLLPKKSKDDFKNLMHNIFDKKSIQLSKFKLETTKNEPLEMTICADLVNYYERDAIQLQFIKGDAIRTSCGSRGDAIDEFNQLIFEKQSPLNEDDTKGCFVYLWLQNYRDVLQKDGYDTAETLLSFVENMIKEKIDQQLDMLRFSDDVLLFWINDSKTDLLVAFKKIINTLDVLIPDNIGRIIHPVAYASILELNKETVFSDVVSKSSRTVQSLANKKSNDRVAEPFVTRLSRKDEERLHLLQILIDQSLIAIKYQPIVSLKTDGFERYTDSLYLREISADQLAENEGLNVEEDELDLEFLKPAINRFYLDRVVTRHKIVQFLKDAQIHSKKGKPAFFMISIMTDALLDKTFFKWLDQQLQANPFATEIMILSVPINDAIEHYSRVLQLVQTFRKQGIRFALTDVGSLDKETIEVIDHIKPEIITINLGGISTYEDVDVDNFMNSVQKMTDDNHALIIAGNMTSAAQLSLIWKYPIDCIFGNGVVEPLTELNYDFSQSLF